MRTSTKLVSLSLAVVLPLAGMVNAGAEEKPAQGKQETGVVAPAAGANGEAGKGAGNAAAGNGASGNQAEAGKDAASGAGAASGTGAAGKPGEKAGGSSAKVSGSSDKVKGSSERGKAGSSAIAENKDNKTLKFLGIIAGIVGIGGLISAGLTWAVQQRLIANPLPGSPAKRLVAVVQKSAAAATSSRGVANAAGREAVSLLRTKIIKR